MGNTDSTPTTSLAASPAQVPAIIRIVNITSKTIGVITSLTDTIHEIHTTHKMELDTQSDTVTSITIGDFNSHYNYMTQSITIDATKLYNYFVPSSDQLNLYITDNCHGYVSFDEGNGPGFVTLGTNTTSDLVKNSDAWQENGDTVLYISYNPVYFVKGVYNSSADSVTFSQTYPDPTAIVAANPAIPSCTGGIPVTIPDNIIDLLPQSVQDAIADYQNSGGDDGDKGDKGKNYQGSGGSGGDLPPPQWGLILLVIFAVVIAIGAIAFVIYRIKKKKGAGMG